ncbi:MAG: ATP-binding protein [Ignavibacteriota bacterium]
MPENQNIEYKQSWHADNLKTICAFANSNGGKLYIGKEDNGNTVGVTDSKILMVDLPGRIRNDLGITTEINLLADNNLEYIEIIVIPYLVAISLRGKYYVRSGSTTVEITGNTLNDFLLHKSGQTWDGVIEERATIDDLSKASIGKYKVAVEKAGRITLENELEDLALLEKLRLADGTKIKRGAVILFAQDPGKFYPNISVKIGRFGKTDDDLISQEVIEGNILKILFDVPEILNNKFLTKKIDFEGLQRIEKGEYPVAAIREMLLNALVHKNYSGAQIQLRVYDDKITIWNEGDLPEGLTFESLKRQHPSRPRNPLIADACFKGGYIDTWGRGTLKIINSCSQAGLPEPELIGIDGGVKVTIFKDRYTEEQLKKLGLNDRQIKAVLFVKENKKITNKDFQTLVTTSGRTALRDLEQLVVSSIFEKIGEKKGTYYQLKNGG